MKGLRNIAENLRPTRQIIEGQMTVDEMLASCPNCAGEMVPKIAVSDGMNAEVPIERCEDCGFVREPDAS